MPVVQWTLYLGYLCMVTISAVPSLCTLCTLYVSVRSFILDPRFHMRKNRSPGQKPMQYRRSEHTPATWWRRTMLTHTYKYSCWENKIYIPYINQNIYIDHFDFLHYDIIYMIMNFPHGCLLSSVFVLSFSEINEKLLLHAWIRLL